MQLAREGGPTGTNPAAHPGVVGVSRTAMVSWDRREDCPALAQSRRESILWLSAQGATEIREP